jgi:sialidase-1
MQFNFGARNYCCLLAIVLLTFVLESFGQAQAPSIRFEPIRIPVVTGQKCTVGRFLIDSDRPFAMESVQLQLASDLPGESLRIFVDSTELLVQENTESDHVWRLKTPKAIAVGESTIPIEVLVSEKASIQGSFQMQWKGAKEEGREYSIGSASHQSTKWRLARAIHRRGESKCHTTRIPGITTTSDGSLIAVFDMRFDGPRDLQGHIDIGMSRSIDQGQTWTAPVAIMDMGTHGDRPQSENGCSDPNILFVPATNEIIVSALWVHGKPNTHQWVGRGSEPGFEIGETAQFMVVRSKDNGSTWTTPENWTRQVKREEWYLFAPSPGNGIVTRNGTWVIPSQGRDAQGFPFSNVMWSDDQGKHWTVSAPARDNTTESTVAELVDGLWMLNMRDNRNRDDKTNTNGRSISTTVDRGQHWSIHPSDHSALPEPVCMGALLATDLADGPRILLFSNPRSKTHRKEMTIQCSLDSGNSWPNRILLDELGGAYSCMTMLDRNTIGIIYESSQANLVFQAIPLEAILTQ